ncbi:hypothetical protein PISMIDRAFT_19728 [Pisolithus microcarpus 441]|uniref:Uncharacterized protein n=1 Tax=Pisolithus microcarpus 441 TaxID=765257 RepID=A0A0C9YB27_9AGAM|nr:hypothetical protein PISMIDRAFT_19728 [Pisolithus microcarpus 441]
MDILCAEDQLESVTAQRDDVTVKQLAFQGAGETTTTFWMTMSREFAQVCICGRSFSDIAAFTRHNRNCQRGKKRLSGALTRVKEIYQNKRPRRLVGEEGTHSAFHEDGTALIEDPTNGYPGPSQPRESGQLRELLTWIFSFVL